MTSTVSAIEAIEKAMEGVTHGDWYLAGKLTIRHTSPVGGTDGWIGKVNWRNGAANADYIAACKPAAMREVLALARQAEALQRENAELREALKPFATDADNWSDGVPHTHKTLCTEPNSTTAHPGSEAAFTVGDLRRARALLGGSENAE